MYLLLGTDDEVILSQGALLFLFRYAAQGLGQTFMPTLAGFMKLVMRRVAAFILVPRFEFLGASVFTPLF